jgi:hypothetical protein
MFYYACIVSLSKIINYFHLNNISIDFFEKQIAFFFGFLDLNIRMNTEIY